VRFIPKPQRKKGVRQAGRGRGSRQGYGSTSSIQQRKDAKATAASHGADDRQGRPANVEQRSNRRSKKSHADDADDSDDDEDDDEKKMTFENASGYLGQDVDARAA